MTAMEERLWYVRWAPPRKCGEHAPPMVGSGIGSRCQMKTGHEGDHYAKAQGLGQGASIYWGNDGPSARPVYVPTRLLRGVRGRWPQSDVVWSHPDTDCDHPDPYRHAWCDARYWTPEWAGVFEVS